MFVGIFWDFPDQERLKGIFLRERMAMIVDRLDNDCQ